MRPYATSLAANHGPGLANSDPRVEIHGLTVTRSCHEAGRTVAAAEATLPPAAQCLRPAVASKREVKRIRRCEAPGLPNGANTHPAVIQASASVRNRSETVQRAVSPVQLCHTRVRHVHVALDHLVASLRHDPLQHPLRPTASRD